VLVGTGALALGAHAPAHRRVVCRTVTEHVLVKRQAAPLRSAAVHAHATRTVRVRVCRAVSVRTTVTDRHATVRRTAANPLAHIPTTTRAALHLTVPVSRAAGPPISLGVSLSASPFDGMAE
jgi:hypothetical protein